MSNIIKHIKYLVLIACCCWVSSTLLAQRETEVFIPIGKSPGVSGKLSIIGKVTATNVRDSTVTIEQGASAKTVKLTGTTDIFLDKSKLKRTNTLGSFADIRTGLTVEVKFRDNQVGRSIDWIKVQLE